MISGDGEEMDGVALPGWGFFGGGLRSPMKTQREWQDKTDGVCVEASDAVRGYLAAHAERLAADGRHLYSDKDHQPQVLVSPCPGSVVTRPRQRWRQWGDLSRKTAAAVRRSSTRKEDSAHVRG